MNPSVDNHKRERSIYRVTIVGSVANFLLLSFKLLAGILGRSSAMIADAVHSVTDFVTDIIVLVFVRIAGKPQDKDHEYGHGKYETLATAIIGLSLAAVGVMLFASAARHIWDFFHGEALPQPGIIALVAAIVSIVVKEGLYHYTVFWGKKLDSQAVVANAWHHRSDALSSLGTLVGIGGAIALGKHWAVLDPLAAALVSILIVKVSWVLLKQSLGDLMEVSLGPEVRETILKAIAEEPEVSNPHNLRTRRIGTRKAVDVHVRMDGNLTVSHSHEVTRRMEKRLRDLLGPDAIVTIHVEPRN